MPIGFAKYMLPFLMGVLGSCNFDPTTIVSDADAMTPEHDIANAHGTVVIELFQSQGCSSCPPANAAVNAIAGRNDLIALSYGVTYWDKLGWKDTFADPAYTQRQYSYAKALGDDGVYTPQIILNGQRAIVGNGPGELNRAISKSSRLAVSPAISAAQNDVTIGPGNGSADIILVRYDLDTRMVSIRAGENGGQKLPHRNIVRQFTSLGTWDGARKNFVLPPPPKSAQGTRLQSVILVQKKNAGPILTAIRI